MRELMKEGSKKFFGQLWDDVLGYLKVYDYLKLKAKSTMGKATRIPSIDSFWYSVLGDKFAGNRKVRYTRLLDGDVIKMKDVFLSEWVPKLPGRIWTTEGVVDFTEGQQHVGAYVRFNDNVYAVLDPYGKRKVLSAGFGSIRVSRKGRNEQNYMLMSVTSADHWLCDYGIPVVVSKPVYKEFLNYARNGAPWLKSLEGILHINQEIPLAELIPKALGASLSRESEDTLRYRPSLPKCYIHISSPLSVKFTHNDSHPDATAWTMFETSDKREFYRYTYTKFNPADEGSVTNAVSFINWYVKEYEGKRIVTDFDGQVPRLDSIIPISTNPMTSSKASAKRIVLKCDKWVQSSMKGLSRRY